MKQILALIETFIVHNWKTTALGLIGALEYYQNTNDLKGALTIFVTGLVMKDADKSGGSLPKATGSTGATTAMILVLGGALFFAAPARAQDAAPPPPASMLSADLGGGFSLHPGVTMTGFGYSITDKQMLGKVAIGGIYLLDYKEKVAVGVGGSLSTDAAAPGATVDVALLSPTFTVNGQKQRVGVANQYVWAGALHKDMIVAVYGLYW